MNAVELDNYLKKNQKKVLLFDFDETLFRLRLPWQEYISQTHRILKEVAPQDYEAHARESKTNYDIINALTKKAGQHVRDQCLAYALEFETKQLAGYDQNHELTDWVQANKDNYHFFVWSSNCAPAIQPILDHHTLAEVFEEVVGRDVVVYTKPEPEGFEYVSRYLQQQGKSFLPQDYLMIGNSHHSDGGAAQNAGIDFFVIDFFETAPEPTA